MSTTDTHAEQIKALAHWLYKTTAFAMHPDPWAELDEDARNYYCETAAALLDGPVAAMIAQAERAAAAKAWDEGARAEQVRPRLAAYPPNPYRADRIEGGQ